MVSSAGNSGHGYGTIGLPNASPTGISVGATTNNVFVGYGPVSYTHLTLPTNREV